MHTMHTFILIFPYPFVSKGFRGIEGMRRVMHTGCIPMHTTGFFPVSVKNGTVSAAPDAGIRIPTRDGAPFRLSPARQPPYRGMVRNDPSSPCRAPHPVPWRGIGCGAGNPPL